MNKQNILIIIVLAFAGFYYFQNQNNPTQTSTVDVGGGDTVLESKNSTDDTDKIQKAFQNHQSDLQVQSSGVVVAILKDDNEGSRHQKFILELSNGQTVLIAHNIDLAPRIDFIQKGDVVEFYGEYEYTDKGGVIHWTHHDPQKRHVDGWLKHQGKVYQ